ncbi:CRISP/Allergen/PR-1-like [Argiope bruennichi]|uniref:CRISP/Allergen/PR-1-like n=1 Tax=Argiope bruennichi TaxID=94029 RepID=UPI002494661D|nr:CRISP/Allergen/PR-1-like [Argiope bruennichi]
MRSLFLLAFFCLVGWSTSQRCPARYIRFTPQHTYCLSPNPTCQVKRKGVSEQDKQLILRLHNQFRSKVAMGNEDRSIGGALPQAADMMEMVWDDELAAVAQKWTENCEWGHDCGECKAVENFAVGQNLAIQNWSPCYGPGCQEPSNEPDWTWAITALYDEVVDYRVNWLDSFTKHPGPKTGHFTQLVWSKSWRIGCGYSYYKQAGGFHLYYACNYGPGGNVEGEPVYKTGLPCSSCPTNTQCSPSSRFAKGFPGLCRMEDASKAPVYPERNRRLLFLCDFTSPESNCAAEITGSLNWEKVFSVGGNYNSIILNGGRSTTVTFKNPITPHQGAFCLIVNFRKGPLDASRSDESSFKANFKMDYAVAPPMELNPRSTTFKQFNIDLGWGIKTTLGFTFSVPGGAAQHVLDIRKVVAFDGTCDSINEPIIF